MPFVSILLIAGIVLFVLSLTLFRARRHADAGVGSIWKGGSVAARAALLAWWMSLLLLGASVALRLTEG